MVHTGIPVDAAELVNLTGTFQERLKQFPTQSLHGFVEMFDVVGFVSHKPLPIVIHADAPEKIHGLWGETFKHTDMLLQGIDMPSIKNFPPIVK
jgi:hypothetical protein